MMVTAYLETIWRQGICINANEFVTLLSAGGHHVSSHLDATPEQLRYNTVNTAALLHGQLVYCVFHIW